MQYFKVQKVDGKIDEHHFNDGEEVEAYLNEHYPNWEEAEVLHYLRAGNVYDDVKYRLRKDGPFSILWLMV